MTPNQAVREVNRLWEYKSDGWFDNWNFTTRGDCEDYSLSVLLRIFGSQYKAKMALLRGKATLWYVTTDTGNKHAILEYQGRYVCNRTRAWQTDRDKMRVSKWHFTYPKALILFKLGLSKIF